jgi:GDP-L-fucose synthase
MAGSAIVRQLRQRGYEHLLLKNRDELDLTQQQAVKEFFLHERPDYVFLAAARVGGILANNIYRGEFIYNNLMIETNVIHAAWEAGVKRLLFLGSSCIYPRDCPQPIREEYLLTGPLEDTNEPYAIAKIAGIKLCESYNRQYGTQFVSIMPTNLYGPNDNYDLHNSHVLPALIRKAHEGKVQHQKELMVWGTGSPKREFLYVDDMADACIFIMEQGITSGLFNVGTGKDISIANLAQMVLNIVGFKAEIRFNPDKPDGTPQKLLQVDRLRELGWHAQTPLEEGIRLAYQDFLRTVNPSLSPLT